MNGHFDALDADVIASIRWTVDPRLQSRRVGDLGNIHCKVSAGGTSSDVFTRKSMNRFITMFMLIASLAVVGTTFAQAPVGSMQSSNSETGASAAASESGLAAVYSEKLNGHRTANGQVYDPHRLTAAHKTLPFGSKVKVTNTKNGKSVIVRINDRGPMQAGRVLDLTPRAAHALGIGRHAMAAVIVQVQS